MFAGASHWMPSWREREGVAHVVKRPGILHVGDEQEGQGVDESQWLRSEDPLAILASLREDLSQRKARLFAVACCRLIWDLLEDHASSRKALEFAERYADGLETRQRLRGQAWGKSGGAWPALLYDAWVAARGSAEYAVERAARAAV